MKKLSVYLISFFLIFQGSLWAYSSDPKNFIDELVSEAISKLSDKNLTKEQKKFLKKLKVIKEKKKKILFLMK